MKIAQQSISASFFNCVRLVAALVVLLLSGCAQHTPEIEVKFLTLGAPLNTQKAQISGLAWCQDKLLLLPQKPEFAMGDSEIGYSVYTLDREAIEAAIADNSTVLIPSPVELIDEPFRGGLRDFDGYEALVCNGTQFWLAVETKVNDEYFTTTIVRGKGDLGMTDPKIELDAQPLTVIESQSGIWNFSEETLLIDDDHLIAIHEANVTIDQPYAIAINLNDGTQQKRNFPTVAHRITDATAIQNGRFWAINYLWADLEVLKRQPDAIAKRYPPSGTHRVHDHVERLLEFRIDGEKISLTKRSPIYLQLGNDKGRNWEGMVRMGEQGFLLVTDEHPETILGFVPFLGHD